MKLRNMTSVYFVRGEELLCLYRIGSRVANEKYVGAAGGHSARRPVYRQPLWRDHPAPRNGVCRLGGFSGLTPQKTKTIIIPVKYKRSDLKYEFL